MSRNEKMLNIETDYSKYSDLYDFDQSSNSDLEFFLAYVNLQVSPILVLACGTGRLLIEIAKLGKAVWGVDNCNEMLSICKRKSIGSNIDGNVHIVNSNMKCFSIDDTKFGLVIIPGRAFMHLYSIEEQKSCLKTIRKHMAKNGKLILTLYAPNFSVMGQPRMGPYIPMNYFTLPDGTYVERYDRFIDNDLVNQIQYCDVLFKKYDSSGKHKESIRVPMNSRYSFLSELQHLLTLYGFKILSVFGDYNKSKFDNSSNDIVIVAEC